MGFVQKNSNIITLVHDLVWFFKSFKKQIKFSSKNGNFLEFFACHDVQKKSTMMTNHCT